MFKALAGLGGVDAVRALISVPAKEYHTLQKNLDADTMDYPTVQRPLSYRGEVLKESLTGW